jgi:pyrroloquinoline quinone biosynthesis protein B
MDGQIDHVAGLLMLREASQAWKVYCTDAVHAELTDELPLLSVLSHYCGWQHQRIEPQRPFNIEGIEAVTWLPIELQSKAPPYSRHRSSPTIGSNSALVLRNDSSNRTALYAPGIGEMSAQLWEHMKRASLVLVDGTCWTDDELPRLGVANRLARDMGHLPLDEAGGMIEWLDRLPSSTRKVLVHINNTNPILDEASSERAELAEHDIEVAHDGMEFEL